MSNGTMFLNIVQATSKLNIAFRPHREVVQGISLKNYLLGYLSSLILLYLDCEFFELIFT